MVAMGPGAPRFPDGRDSAGDVTCEAASEEAGEGVTEFIRVHFILLEIHRDAVDTPVTLVSNRLYVAFYRI